MKHRTEHKFTFARGNVPMFVGGTTTPTCQIVSDDEVLQIKIHTDDLDAWIEALIEVEEHCRQRQLAAGREAERPVG